MLNPLPTSEWTRVAAAHLLNRAGFGGSPAEIDRFHALGHRGAIEQLLAAEEEADLFPFPEMESLSAKMRELRMEALEGAELEERKKQERKLRNELGIDLRYWWLHRMRETPNSVREKATLFWHGHWATGLRKVNDPFFMHRQNETLRAHALGPFAPLAKEISRDPAMIIYLDLQSNSSKKPNENFAREVMELFTLGEGHYSERDIVEVARAFTGYRVDRDAGGFRFHARQADAGSKTILGVTGAFSGDEAIDIVAAHPRCADFIAGKIWAFYAGMPPAEHLQRTLGEKYRKSGMDTGTFLKTLFASREFFAPDVVRRQIKSPVQWLVQMCKVLEIPLPPPRIVHPLMANLGQVLFDPPNVKGWEGGRAWISSSTLLVRYNAAGTIVRGGGGAMPDIDRLIPPGQAPEAMADELAWRLFQSPMPAALRERTISMLKENGASPAARRDLLHLLMSTPEFQLT
jgi:uncharacterized protein (DUF1800 family)